jgi:hypothetical protein
VSSLHWHVGGLGRIDSAGEKQVEEVPFAGAVDTFFHYVRRASSRVRFPILTINMEFVSLG